MKLLITTILFLLVITFSFQEIVYAQPQSLAEAKILVDSFLPQQDSAISIGVLVTLNDDWHIYWRNPGDSGIETEIEFILPKDITASEINFPIPEVIATDEIVNYGYSHRVLFISDLKIPKDFKPNEINISAKITSLICKDICIAFDTTVTIKIDVSVDYVADSEVSKLFESTKQSLPQKFHNLETTARLKSDIVYLTISGDEILKPNSVKFLSYAAGIFRNSTTQNIIQKEKFIEIILDPDPFRIKNPDFINGILLIDGEDKSANPNLAFEIKLPITN